MPSKLGGSLIEARCRFCKRAQVQQLDKNLQWSGALDGADYLLGMVSPHEFLQVINASDKRFQIGVQSEPVEFMSWLLRTLKKKSASFMSALRF
ncbi:hypothetical protein COLO4_07903 [Corchorus olitorius]|uniref:Uncharacterized protein n=1 Tax=Corchorus olitorius TaxID=93759 RepID=A0A1R3KIE7_9ROSI|nr:hypothetical protein COLO4_07903 [Corchorus olitorius]